jgi:hypothetical protein
MMLAHHRREAPLELAEQIAEARVVARSLAPGNGRSASGSDRSRLRSWFEGGIGGPQIRALRDLAGRG